MAGHILSACLISDIRGERVQDAHRTADENAAEKKMSHDIPVSNDF